MPGLSAVCFNCNSRADPKCDDTVDPARLPYMDCSSDYFKTVIDGATRGFTEVQDAFLAYPTVAYSESTCQKLVVQGKSDANLTTKFHSNFVLQSFSSTVGIY